MTEMTIIKENETNHSLTTAQEMLIDQVIEAVLEHRGCPYEAQVSLTIVGNEEIQALNKEYRDIDKATDVLSFPLIDFDSPADFKKIEAQEGALGFYFDPDSGELVLGDIVLCYDKAEDQAQAYGHSFERELGFLIVHSMLHLLGYDHMEEAEESIMFKLQEEILDKAGLKR